MSKCERFAQVTQDKWATVRELLRSLMTNVAHDKWVNVSDSLRSLRTNEWIDRFFEQIDHFYLSLTKNKRLAQKKNFFNHIFCTFFTVFFKKQKICSFLLSEVSESLRLLRTNERPQAICSGRSEGMSDREQIAQVSNQKMSKWANHSLFEQIAHLLTFFAKTSDSLQNSLSEFPTLWIWGSWKFVYITHTIKKLLGKEKKKF